MLTRLTSAAALAGCLALSACGGGDDGDGPITLPPAPTDTVPSVAVETPATFVTYLKGQSFSDETSEPLFLPAGDLPTSETDEPLAI